MQVSLRVLHIALVLGLFGCRTASSVIAVNDRERYAHWLQSAAGFGRYDYDIILAYSPDRGTTWSVLPPIRKGRATGHAKSSYEVIPLVPRQLSVVISVLGSSSERILPC